MSETPTQDAYKYKQALKDAAGENHTNTGETPENSSIAPVVDAVVKAEKKGFIGKILDFIKKFSDEGFIAALSSIFLTSKRETSELRREIDDNIWTKTYSEYKPKLDKIVEEDAGNIDKFDQKAEDLGIPKKVVKEYKKNDMILLCKKPELINNDDTQENGLRLKGKELLKNKAFMDKLASVATDIGSTTDALIKVMKAESSLDPRVINKKSGASGLIQFIPDTALDLGTTVGKIRQMTAIEQLDYVKKYYLRNNRGHPLTSVVDLYKATFYPASLGKGPGYVFGGEKVANQNQGVAKYSKRSDGLIDGYAFEEYVKKHTA